MKIKTDFVTNSSSSSYVVFIPPGTMFTREAYMKYMESEDHFDCWAEDEKQLCYQQAQMLLERLKEGKIVYQYDEHENFYFLSDFLSKEGLIFGSTPVSSDDGNIMPIKKEDIERAFLKMHRDEVKGMLKKDEQKI